MRIKKSGENGLTGLSDPVAQEEDTALSSVPPTYPCKGCGNEREDGSCTRYHRCAPFLAWFGCEWRGIRKAAGKE